MAWTKIYIANMTRNTIEMIQGMNMLDLDPDERKALLKYMEGNRKYATWIGKSSRCTKKNSRPSPKVRLFFWPV